MKTPNLNNFGKNLKFNKRSSKKDEEDKGITEKEMFTETVEMFQNAWDRSNSTYEKFQINLLEYEEKFYQIIENLFLIKYGLWRTEIILWYIFARVDNEDGSIAPLLIQIEGKEDEEVILKTPEELWDLLERLGKDPNIKNLDK